MSDLVFKVGAQTCLHSEFWATFSPSFVCAYIFIYTHTEEKRDASFSESNPEETPSINRALDPRHILTYTSAGFPHSFKRKLNFDLKLPPPSLLSFPLKEKRDRRGILLSRASFD